MAVQLTPYKGRNGKHSSLENVDLIMFCTKISFRLYHNGMQFSCQLITGRNDRDLSQGNVLLHIFLV